MSRFGRILLSGLVALLMVGMVSASEISAPVGGSVDVLPIGGHIGTWVEGVCIDTSDEVCFKLWISIDVGWLKALLF